MTNVIATRAAVTCRGVTKVFGEGEFAVQALRGIDLDVLSSELLMLVGPSGCGKTTLISVIAGILDRTRAVDRARERTRVAFPTAQKTRVARRATWASCSRRSTCCRP
jgi:putative ABC transport system ATP-binding protein